MNKGYAVFCDADRWFYDAPYRRGGDGGYAAELPAMPEDWQSHRSGDWLAWRPAEHHLPAQGWKIHVSAGLDNAPSVLARVRDYCVPRRLAFKFVPNRYLLHIRNAKYADRAGAGKFVTVYPADLDEFRRTAEELDALLAGEPGPYVLSDLRWNQGPVYVRYGSFTLRHCHDERGELVPALEDPEGTLVPDPRGPAFRMPAWVTPPDFLRPHLDARAALTLDGLPYTVERALHFSNGGGVYLARDTATGERVVLKEARPYAGLAADGADAVTRLHRERAALERLAGLGCVPAVRGSFTIGEHHFLALEYLEGKPLNTFFARRHPLIEADPDPAALASYTRWALAVHGEVTRAVEAVHARGIVFNDLHLFNIMIREHGENGENEGQGEAGAEAQAVPTVFLLDFEAAAGIADNARQIVANPAFVAPADRRGASVDRYALACLRLALFLPLTSLLPLDRTKAAHLARIACEQFPVPREFLDEAVAEILAGPDGTPGPVPAEPYLPVPPGEWPTSRDSLAAAIASASTPGRDDRLFPGDIAQFARPGGGLTVGYGAAGVLYALAETGRPAWPEAEEWLLERTKDPASGTPSGFYDGLAGIAWTLERLGHPARALELAERITAQRWDNLAPDLHSGLAGIGLALDALATATGERDLHDAALRCAERLADPAREGDGASGPRARAGLLYGASGRALLLLRLYERLGDRQLLTRAADFLRADLARCVTSAFGTLQVDEGWRTMPYLGEGSAGIGMVLDDYLQHAPDEAFEQARRQIVRAAQATFYAQPGLFRGAAGMVLHLARTTCPGPGTGPADIGRQIEALARHAVPYKGQLAFPGEQMMRLSMDLATGSAGVLLALGSAEPGVRAQLPFLPPLPRPTNRSRPAGS
ncbi:class III lanthionine synthetase LanKC [Streptomyces sp. NPDC012888]|uniref:class III lanthionine synthetase LanKC n=1 Tax=Streptomyces sp. NPDC012888 TaxID=3364855 RepID=UPI00368C08CB